MQANSMDSIPKPQRRKSRPELVHLHCLPSTQPATKIGQVTWAWTEIEAGLAAGMKLKEVWAAASCDGIDVVRPIPRMRLTAKAKASNT